MSILLDHEALQNGVASDALCELCGCTWKSHEWIEYLGDKGEAEVDCSWVSTVYPETI